MTDKLRDMLTPAELKEYIADAEAAATAPAPAADADAAA